MLRDLLPPRDDTKDLDSAPIPAGWRLRRLSGITRDDVAQLHARLGRERGHYAAIVRSPWCGRSSASAVSRGSSATTTRPPAFRMFREEKRDRFLSPDELKRVLKALETEPNWRWRAWQAGARFSVSKIPALLSVRWSDMDLQARSLARLPTTKAGRIFSRLPGVAVELLKSLGCGKSDWLFRRPPRSQGHLEDRKRHGTASAVSAPASRTCACMIFAHARQFSSARPVASTACRSSGAS